MSNKVLYGEINIPPATKNFLKRLEVEKILKKAIKKQLVIVLGGAGYGKTQTVSNFLKNNDENLRYSWFLLNELDNQISRYSERFIYTLALKKKTLAEDIAMIELPFEEESYVVYRELLAGDATTQHRVLVLDDYHFMSNQSMLEFMEKHVLLNIPNFTVIILTRTMPNFDVNKLIEKDLAVLITEENLKLSKSEMIEYFETIGVSLADETIAYLHEYTEGWPFAVDCLAEILESFNLSGRYNLKNSDLIEALKAKTFDYIETEIFNNLQLDVKDLLVKLSSFLKLPIGLINAVDVDCLFGTEAFGKIDSFLNYNAETQIYLLNPLIKDCLQKLKVGLDQETIDALNLTAGDWLSANGYKIEAINRYELCGEYLKLFEIIINFKEFCPLELADYFINLIEKAPKKFVEEKPIIKVVQARYYLNGLQLSKSLERLTKIQKEYEALEKTKENLNILGETYIILAWVSMISSTYEFVELFKKAAQCLPNGSSLIDNRVQMMSGSNIRINNIYKLKKIEIFEAEYFEAMPIATKVMNGCGCGFEYLIAAESAYILKDLKKAENNANLAIKMAQTQKQFTIENGANFVLLKAALAKGDFSGCNEILNMMGEQSKSNLSQWRTPQFEIIEGMFYSIIGETNRVASWIMTEQATKKTAYPQLLNEKNILRARCLLTDGKYYELLAYLEQLIIFYSDKDLLIVNIHLPIIKAIALYYIGEKEEAFKTFEEAYSLSKFGNIIMPFIEYGTKMRTVIHAIRQEVESNIQAEWLDNVYKKASTYARQTAKIAESYKKANSIEPTKTTQLSKRELEVLANLCHGLTRQQIAVSCNLSINTVKSTLQNIYSKLGAANRIEAINITNEMGLLDKHE